MLSAWKTILRIGLVTAVLMGWSVAGWAGEVPSTTTNDDQVQGTSAEERADEAWGVFIDRVGVEALVDDLSEATGLAREAIEKKISSVAVEIPDYTQVRESVRGAIDAAYDRWLSLTKQIESGQLQEDLRDGMKLQAERARAAIAEQLEEMKAKGWISEETYESLRKALGQSASEN